MGQVAVVALRAVLVMLLAGSVFVLTVIVPAMFLDTEDPSGELSHLRVPIIVIFALGVVCAQTVLACVWRLLTMMRRGTVFSHAAFRYVDVITGAFVAAALLVFALGTILAPGEAVAPGVVLLLGGVGLGILGVGLIVLVLRMLLAQAVARDVEATAMRAELDEVI
ncbi:MULTISPECIES: DUF2975 domain-containing protein [unclassified Streptomyces]|uniref:DUF2975 domain-containing protein n=1 Tax=Streptomyces sp. NPDC127129 TaxID=3345373 RepID=UPI003626079E